GDPYLTPVSWTGVQVRFLGQTMALNAAIDRGLIDRTIWSWNGTQYVAASPPQGQILPFNAVWVHALQPLTLILPRQAPLPQFVKAGGGVQLALAGGQRARGSGRAAVVREHGRLAAPVPPGRRSPAPPRAARAG